MFVQISTEPFVSKLCMVIPHHKRESCERKKEKKKKKAGGGGGGVRGEEGLF